MRPKTLQVFLFFLKERMKKRSYWSANHRWPLTWFWWQRRRWPRLSSTRYKYAAGADTGQNKWKNILFSFSFPDSWALTTAPLHSLAFSEKLSSNWKKWKREREGKIFLFALFFSPSPFTQKLSKWRKLKISPQKHFYKTFKSYSSFQSYVPLKDWFWLKNTNIASILIYQWFSDSIPAQEVRAFRASRAALERECTTF